MRGERASAIGKIDEADSRHDRVEAPLRERPELLPVEHARLDLGKAEAPRLDGGELEDARRDVGGEDLSPSGPTARAIAIVW